jgi:hypothetical protein
MIDEAVLEDAFAQLADEIDVPENGADNVVDAAANTSAPTRRDRTRFTKPILAAAAIAAVIAVAVPLLNSSSSRVASKSSRVASSPPDLSANGIGSGAANLRGQPSSLQHGLPGTPAGGFNKTTTQPVADSGSVDGAKIVKTGTLDLQVAHGTLRVTVNRVTGVTVGLGGYVSDSRTSYGGDAPTAQITIRVPVANFESAVAQLDALRGVTVLADSQNGADVTGQYTDLQAQLQAATGERDSLLNVLSHAQSIGDILAVHDRLAAAQTVVDQLQGQINHLGDQAAFSSIAVTLSEKAVPTASAVVHPKKTETGLAKSWTDARRGFADVIEWFIARSGGALIIVLAALALLFGIRYLYPVVRRGLV